LAFGTAIVTAYNNISQLMTLFNVVKDFSIENIYENVRFSNTVKKVAVQSNI
jgi:hypothetical protein